MGVSNNARLWAAAANLNNIKLVNIMSKELKTEMQGNHLLNHLMNIKIIYSDTTNEQILHQEAIAYGNKLKDSVINRILQLPNNITRWLL